MQLKDNDLVYIWVIFDCFRVVGYNDEMACLMIVQCVVVEVWEVMLSGVEFNIVCYIKNLDWLFELFEFVV